MNIDTDSVVTFLIIWGISTFMVVREYLKMNTEDRKSAMRDFKTPHFIFTIGFLYLGSFLTTLGDALTMNIIKIVGIILLMMSGILSTNYMWKRNKIRSIVIFLLTIFIIPVLWYVDLL